MLLTLLATLAAFGAPLHGPHGAGPIPQSLEGRELTVQRVTDTAWRLHYYGANMGLVFGPEGILLIDGGFLLASPQLEAAIGRIYFDWREKTQGIPVPEEGGEPLPYRYIVNTHWHNDHTESNPYFALGGATVIAHPTVRRRLMSDPEMGGKIYSTPMDPAGLPRITVEESLSLYFNGEEVRIEHAPLVHTDGDLWVWLPESKVAFLGDLYASDRFPYIELMLGARPAHLIEELERVMALFPEDTQVVPGHGPATGMDGLRRFHAMVSDCDRQMREAVLAGKTRQDLYNQKMFGEYEDEWGLGVKGFIQILHACYTQLEPLRGPAGHGHDHDHDDGNGGSNG